MLGCNFGLTNLVMAIKRAKELNRLTINVDRLVRHTDGGPDNVAWVTHFFHWLLVYLGVFNEVLWFRFEAGFELSHVGGHLGSTYRVVQLHILFVLRRTFAH